MIAAGSARADQSCDVQADCDDGNSCTTDACVGGPGGVCTWTDDTPCGPFVDAVLPGKKIKLQIPPGNDPEKGVRFLATKLYGLGTSVPLPDATSQTNPVNTGGSLRIFSATGGFDHTYPLPPQGDTRFWNYRGVPIDQDGYFYKDPYNKESAIGLVKVVAGKSVKIRGKGNPAGEQMFYSLAANPDPVHVVLTLANRRYCWYMGYNGNLQPYWLQGALYYAKDTAAPAACP
jgi:hypothetical protein